MAKPIRILRATEAQLSDSSVVASNFDDGDIVLNTTDNKLNVFVRDTDGLNENGELKRYLFNENPSQHKLVMPGLEPAKLDWGRCNGLYYGPTHFTWYPNYDSPVNDTYGFGGMQNAGTWGSYPPSTVRSLCPPDAPGFNGVGYPGGVGYPENSGGFLNWMNDPEDDGILNNGMYTDGYYSAIDASGGWNFGEAIDVGNNYSPQERSFYFYLRNRTEWNNSTIYITKTQMNWRDAAYTNDHNWWDPHYNGTRYPIYFPKIWFEHPTNDAWEIPGLYTPSLLGDDDTYVPSSGNTAYFREFTDPTMPNYPVSEQGTGRASHFGIDPALIVSQGHDVNYANLYMDYIPGRGLAPGEDMVMKFDGRWPSNIGSYNMSRFDLHIEYICDNDIEPRKLVARNMGAKRTR